MNSISELVNMDNCERSDLSAGALAKAEAIQSASAVALWIASSQGLLAMTAEESYAFSTPHQSAMNSAIALVVFFSESRSTYSLKPCISPPLAPKQRLGMP